MIRTSGRPARLFVLAFVLTALLPAAVAAQQAPPSPEEVLGYSIGGRFTDYHGIREYARALAAASPLVELRSYGTSAGGRELIKLIVARPENLQRLDGILTRNAELTRPETSAARAREIAASNPGVVFFSYGVHGNESSSPEAALWTAWDLARGAPEVAGVLDSLVVVIDPNANPDGRERYVQWFRSVSGARPNPNPAAREHREPWPGGRFNHFGFDLNRDWAWATQPETRARLAVWDRFNPQVHVDFHEMGFQTTYFFFPAAAPINPIYPDHVLRWGRRFGEANAEAFDARGWPYYTREDFDLFYPGYGDSWPSLTGAIGMTYEVAGGGTAGLAIERALGDTLTLAHRATQHRVSGHATLRAAAGGKSDLLLDYAASQREAGRGEPDVLLVPGADTTRVRALVDHLGRQGIAVERAERAFRAGGRAFPGFERRADFPAGTYLVRMRQPRGRLAATLLQPETELRAEFSYDISAWSLSYAYGVEAHQVNAAPGGVWRAEVPGAGAPAAVQPPAPGMGYLVAPSEAASIGVIRFLEASGRVRVLGRAATRAGRAWPAGSWFLPVAGNERLQERVAEAGLGDRVTPVASGISEEGIDLGSSAVAAVRLPRVAVLTGEGVTPTSFATYWFYLEQEVGLPFDAVLATDVERADLARYDVVVIPDAGARLLGDGARTALRGWVERGGRLIAVAGGASAVAPMIEVETREAVSDTAPEVARLLRGREERESADWRDRVPGTVLAARLDPAHPLAWGAGAADDPTRLFVLHGGTRIFEPAPGAEAVAHFQTQLTQLSGVISAANLERLEQSTWLLSRDLGRGSVILFAGDPLFRMFWRSTHPLFLNALLLGPNP
jgi:murein tripeptide amidase MpaA